MTDKKSSGGSSLPLLCGLFAVVLSVLVGVLNFSSDDSGVYRFLFETELKSNPNNFYYGCFCFYNKLDNTRMKVGDESFCNGGTNGDTNTSPNGCTSEIIVLSNAFYKGLVLAGDVGVGETFFNEYWTYDENLYDLGDIMTEFTLGITNGTAAVATGKLFKYFVLEQWYQWYERVYNIQKTQSEDKNSIGSHYDIGNDLYESFLDKTMMYTCAFWSKINNDRNARQMTLTEAQINKIDLIANKMDINENDNVLELGSGWGYAAYNINKKLKSNVTAITLSEEQYKYQEEVYTPHSEKIFKSNINPNNDITRYLTYKLLDYRNIAAFDDLDINKIISIGMLEHVGIQRLDELFASAAAILDNTMKRRMKLNKNDDSEYVFGIHYITMHDISPSKIPILKDIACDHQTYIWKYIFPGGCLINPDWTLESARDYGFMLLHQEFFGLHYAKTLHAWRMNWKKNFAALQKSNPKYDKKIYLVFEIYFAWCEAMFRTGHITLVQQIFIKPNYLNKKKVYTKFENVYNQIQIPPRNDIEQLGDK